MAPKQDKYDVVVLGSGIGGLCTAALLAKKGYKTLVAEKLAIIGGRCATLDYKGYKVPTGVVAMPTGGTIKSIFDEVGAQFEIAPITVPPKICINNKIMDMPASGDPLDVFRMLGGEEKEIIELGNGLRIAASWDPPSNDTSLLEFLHRYTRNKNIVSFFNNQADVFVSTGAREVSAREFFLAQKGYINDFSGGYGLPPQGSMVLMKALRKSIEANGGKVITQCRAKRILVKNGVVEGVVLEGKRGEKTVSASAVVSNAGPKLTIDLVGKEHFDEGYLRDVGNMVPTLQIWVTSISDRPLCDVPQLMMLNTRRMLSFITASLVSPDLAPKGKHVHYSISGPVSQIGPWNLRNEVDLHIQDLKDTLPGFNQHAEVLHVGSYWGAWPTLRNAPLAGYREIPRKTPVENLYNVGDGVAKSGGWPGGSPSAALTARLVVEEIENRIKPNMH